MAREVACLFGRKSVHKSGCFRVSSVKYDNRCESDGGLSGGEGKSLARGESQIVRGLTFVNTYNPFPLCYRTRRGVESNRRPRSTIFSPSLSLSPPTFPPSRTLRILEREFPRESLQITHADAAMHRVG